MKILKEKLKIYLLGADSTKNRYIDKGDAYNDSLKYAIISNRNELGNSLKQIEELEKQQDIYNKTTDNTTAKTRAATKAQQAMRDTVTKAIRDWKTYSSVSEASQKNLEKFESLSNENFNNIFNDSKRAEKLRQRLAGFVKAYKETLKEIEGEYTNLDEIIANGGGDAMRAAATKNKEDAGKTLQDKWDEADTQKIIKSFIELSSAIMSVSAALTSLANIPNIWDNESLSAGEKALQITMALGNGVLQLGSAYLTFSTNGEIAANQIKKLAFAQLSQSAATTVEKASNLKLATSFKILGGSAAKALLPLLPYIAVIAAIGTAIYGVVKAYNADADAAKESAIQTQKLKDAYQETKQAADNFKSTLNDYNSAVDNIRTLTAGTDEYKTAIIEANEKAIDLLKTNKDLAKYAYTDENGLISFTKEGRDKILQEQYEKVASAQINYLNSEINTLQKQLTSDWTNFARQRSKEQEQLNKKQQNDLQNYFNSINAPYLQKTSTATDAINQLQRNTKYSKNTELAAGVPRELVDAIAKYMKDNNFSDLSSSQLTNIDEFNKATKDIQDAITNNIDAYVKMANTINQSTQTQKLYAEQMTKAYLQMKGIIDDDGKLSVNEILATRIVEQQGGIDVSDEEILAKRNEIGEAAHWGRSKI